jgi:hypothetical protein
MNKSIFSFITLLVLLFSTSSMALECEGRYDYHDDYNGVHKKIQLKQTMDLNGYEMYEGQIEEYHFSVNFNAHKNTYKLGVYFGPDYTSGSLTTGTYVEGQHLRLSVVNGLNALNILCK